MLKSYPGTGLTLLLALQEIDICIKAFTSLFDVTENRVRRVRDALATTGLPPKNKQGHHNNRPHALTQEEKDLLNEVPSDSERAAIMLRQKDGLKSTLELHQRKGEVFYDRKKAAGMEAQRWDEIEAVCFDDQKNLPCPNITTQDVYYSRQLSFHSFNIHVLSSDKAYLGPIPRSGPKFQDLSKLKQYVSDGNRPFFDNLPCDLNIAGSDPEGVSDAGSDSE
ncbi:hypothetical protein RRG08_059593 [Elysia crispata]|uniref:Uncharacterized protein n=1 Tax=Elysia crispata TaxID=231223 RepID=A0AAE0YJ81_9GAST|nr:hypothetical protein RRG08_059593 [Elysia crispata]